MAFNRRKFLHLATASTLVGAGLSGWPSNYTVHAADTAGYKALVCVFLFGGLDGHDMLIPYDPESYNSYASIRQTLLADYGEARSRDNLLSLDLGGASPFGSRQFALPPEMPQLKSLFDQQRISFVANVGPLLEPVTAADFSNGTARLPSRLFSHNDQQSTWQASAPEGAQLGWGGLFADAAIAAGANVGGSEFTTLSTAGVGPFLTGNVAAPYQVSLTGSAGIQALTLGGSNPGAFSEFLDRATDRFRAEGFDSDSVLARDIAAKLRQSVDSNALFDAARANAIPLATAFPESSLGSQLKAVAETISLRTTLSASRQIFFVGTGGFDTHSNQASDLPALLGQIDAAFAAFNAALDELGVSQNVTTFTASDFGRTLAVNGDGTDHGWGGHQIVMGAAVNGGTILGDISEARLGHDLDSGGGRLIPSLSVEQFAEPLGRWWGLNGQEIASALPNLTNFDAANLNLFS
ncbi:MAG: DUF1501 domain-containing protein [Pseudomonadota bacterium]